MLENFNLSFVVDIHMVAVNICDVSWENPPHVTNFAEINKIILKLLCFSPFFINFDNT